VERQTSLPTPEEVVTAAEEGRPPIRAHEIPEEELDAIHDDFSSPDVPAVDLA
jgi:hypothetical protein